MKVIKTALLVAALVLVGCSSDEDSPTSPVQVPPVAGFSISIDGSEVAFTTIEPGMGASTLYRAFAPDLPAGMAVRMQFDGPGMMGNHHGSRQLFDDGTHGDLHPGDGWYCFEDLDGAPGMHMMDAMFGHYEFAFYCLDGTGHEGPWSECWVDVD